MPIGAAIGAGVLSAGAGVYEANQAAGAQESAAKKASNTQMQMFDTMQSNLAPYQQAGTTAFNNLTGQMPTLTKTFNPTMDQLAATPGYQFTLGQGEQAVQNSYAAKGLGTSGAALKGATQYAEGLASTTYQQQFEDYLQQNQQQYNMLYQPAALQYQTGEAAAAGVGTGAIQTGSSIGSNIMGAGNAAAGADIASANAIGGALNPMSLWYMMNYNPSSTPAPSTGAGAWGGVPYAYPGG